MGNFESLAGELGGKTENLAGTRSSRGRLSCGSAGTYGENWRTWENFAGKTGLREHGGLWGKLEDFGENSVGKSWRERFAGVLFGEHVGDIITCVNSTFLLA